MKDLTFAVLVWFGFVLFWFLCISPQMPRACQDVTGWSQKPRAQSRSPFEDVRPKDLNHHVLPHAMHVSWGQEITRGVKTQTQALQKGMGNANQTFSAMSKSHFINDLLIPFFDKYLKCMYNLKRFTETIIIFQFYFVQAF